MSARTPSALLPLLLLTGCSSSDYSSTPSSTQLDLSPVAVTASQSGLAKGWSKGGVFIEIYVRGYQDSDGDGIGDLKGLTSRLDYLAELGVEGIWLMPITASQDHDHGYAVTDYRKIEADYGTEEDLKTLLAAAHARGIGVIMDYVVNHSARRNPLFIDSTADVADKRDWYVWKPNNPGWVNWDGNPTWHAESGRYFYGVFWDQMPDFNLRNPDVIAYHNSSMRYWLNLGLDGFRFDAVGQLVENGMHAYESQPENQRILANIQQLVTQDYENRYMVCEEPADPITAASNSSCGSAFAFGFNDHVRASVHGGRVTGQLHKVLTSYPLAQMGVMLGNHDAFAGERLMDDFNGNLDQYRLAVATQMTMPGQPFIYYGEEIGMNHSDGNSGDWGLRAPMSWSSNDTGGFSTATPFRAYAANRDTNNVAAQQADRNSLLNFYKALIAARKANPPLRHGDLTLLESDRVLAYSRSYQGERMVVVLNYAKDRQDVALTLPAGAGTLQPLTGFGTSDVAVAANGSCALSLAGSAVQIYRFAASG